jgi:peroxiredoxin
MSMSNNFSQTGDVPADPMTDRGHAISQADGPAEVVDKAKERPGKSFRRAFFTVVIAHVVGSYGACVPPLLQYLSARQAPPNSSWIYAALAPVSAPTYLAVMTVADFPHYYRYLPQAWAGYTIAFVAVCLLRRKTVRVVRTVAFPIAMTLLVTALWLPRYFQENTPWHSPLEGKAAPDFSLTTLGGNTCRLSQERGHVVLIDFWATWCPPCRAELKQVISKLADDASLRQRGLRVWAVDLGQNSDEVQKFMRENHYSFDALLDPQQTSTKAFPTAGIPTTYVIGRDGSVHASFQGFDSTVDAKLRAAISAALD